MSRIWSTNYDIPILIRHFSGIANKEYQISAIYNLIDAPNFAVIILTLPKKAIFTFFFPGGLKIQLFPVDTNTTLKAIVLSSLLQG